MQGCGVNAHPSTGLYKQRVMADITDVLESLEHAPITGALRSDLTVALHKIRSDMHSECAAILESAAKVTEGVASAALAALAAEERTHAELYAAIS